MSSIDKTLDERGQRYGEFASHAHVTQRLKRAMGQHPGWRKLADDQREALEMTAHKIGRILNGDPDYIDSWHDIIGYVRLVEQRLEREQGESAQTAKTTDPQSFAPTGGLKQHIDRVIADLSRQKLEADNKPIETCDCPACSLELALQAMFPDTKVEVVFLGEETGRTD